jgi:hypothetical protein
VSLREWLANGWLTEHRTSAQEIADLLHVADRDLHDCQTPGLSPDWRLNIAYNAALQAATAALAAAGYRPARESHHFRVIHSLAHTIGLDAGLVRLLDRFRKKRNIGGYERAGTVSDAEAAEMIELARQIRRSAEDWLRREHAALLGGTSP